MMIKNYLWTKPLLGVKGSGNYIQMNVILKVVITFIKFNIFNIYLNKIILK
jgi:hypothetical protein